MKRLLLILTLGLIFCKQAYANPSLQQYVFEKLYGEYSYCTVYYKFLSRGVEIKKDIASLTEKEKLFVKEMNNLSEEAEKNMYFFSSKINLSSESIQLNIQEIYKAYLDIAGRDYSKTELLNDKYYALCSNSLEDPKSRMVYWESEFKKLKGNNPNLSNRTLTCASFKDWERRNILFGIFFNSEQIATVLHIKDFELIEAKYNLETEVDKIKFTLDTSDINHYEDNNLPAWFNLNRESLGFNYRYKNSDPKDIYSLQIIRCDLSEIDSYLVLKEFMNTAFQKKIKNQKKQNKI